MNIKLTRMGERGQMVIPQSIRQAMNLARGSLFSIARLDGNTLLVRRFDEKRLYADFRKERVLIEELKSRI